MMKGILLLVSVSFANFICLTIADGCTRNDRISKSPLHHITEFGKRSKVEGSECKNASNSKNSGSIHRLGLHGFLHARSQKKIAEQAITKGKNTAPQNITIQTPQDKAGSKRSSAELHKLQLKAETISMLHKIVEKYFPGGHLTVDQKIKALKILGKLIKLKKEGKNSEIKHLLGALSAHNSVSSSILKIKNKATKEEDSGKKDKTDESGGGDIYANIASGPDVPKLPPSVSEKDPDHAHSNIMPVGLQGGGGTGETMSAMTHPNDISDNLDDRVSSYQAPLERPQGGMGLGQDYRNGNNFLGNGMGLSSIPSMMNGQGYVRSRMPYPRRAYHSRYWESARRPYYDEDDEDDDEDDEYDDEDEDDDDSYEEENGRTRSYVHRNGYYDDDDDDNGNRDEEIEYTRRFDRKDKIAKAQNESKEKKSG